MKFLSLNYIWLLWLIPLWIIVFLWASRSRKQKTKSLIHEKLWETIIPDHKKTRRVFKFILFLMAFSLIIISLLRPQWGYELREVQQKGVDLFVLVDTSQSMAAKDISPSRMERAKFELIDLLEILNGDRIGLIPFAGQSYVASPLTSDYSAFRLFIDQLNTDLIPINGTNIESALKMALKAFPEGSINSRAIILITDGETTLGNNSKIIEELVEQGVRIYVIGIGSNKGAPIPLEDGSFVKDQSGNLVISKLNESSLKDLALNTNGVYVRSVNGDLDLEKIYLSGIKKVLQEKDLKSQEREIPIERFQFPLGLAIILLVLESFIRDVKRKSRKN